MRVFQGTQEVLARRKPKVTALDVSPCFPRMWIKTPTHFPCLRTRRHITPGRSGSFGEVTRTLMLIDERAPRGQIVSNVLFLMSRGRRGS